MKRVGIFLRNYKSNSNNDLLAIRKDLFEYLNKYSLEIICIPISYKNNEYDEFEKIIKIIQECNGIILPGGGGEVEEIDLKIVKYLYKNNIPTFGICMGMQIMALTFDGALEKINSSSHQSEKEYVHEIKIQRNSKLYEIVKEPVILVNSRHNEHVTTTDLSISAISTDLTIEAVEDKEKTFFIGVEWHPESLDKNLYSKRLFDYFISKL